MLPSNCVFTVVKKSPSSNFSTVRLITTTEPAIEVYTSNEADQRVVPSVDQDNRYICGSRKRKVTSNVRNYDVEDFLYEEEMEQMEPGILVTIPSENYAAQKRVRLAHLSEDEKMLRRKVMNRMAAQQARDRKKLRLDYLEEAVLQLEGEKKFLADENAELQAKLYELNKKYNELNQQVSRLKNRHDKLASARNSTWTASGSAAGTSKCESSDAGTIVSDASGVKISIFKRNEAFKIKKVNQFMFDEQFQDEMALPVVDVSAVKEIIASPPDSPSAPTASLSNNLNVSVDKHDSTLTDIDFSMISDFLDSVVKDDDPSSFLEEKPLFANLRETSHYSRCNSPSVLPICFSSPLNSPFSDDSGVSIVDDFEFPLYSNVFMGDSVNNH